MANSFNLKECPFCGAGAPVVAIRSSYEMGEADKDPDYEFSTADKAVNCNINDRGCGASSRWSRNIDDCRDNWNNRVNIIPPVQVKVKYPKQWCVRIGHDRFVGNLETIHKFLECLQELKPGRHRYLDGNDYVTIQKRGPEITLYETECLTLEQEAEFEARIAAEAELNETEG